MLLKSQSLFHRQFIDLQTKFKKKCKALFQLKKFQAKGLFEMKNEKTKKIYQLLKLKFINKISNQTYKFDMNFIQTYEF
jgi:hypothetical protein